MNQQTPDLLRFAQIIGRYRNLIGYMAVVGLLAGTVFAALNPPGFTARAAVLFSAPSCPAAGAICGGPAFSPDYSVAALPDSFPGTVQVTQGLPDVVVVTTTAGTAAQAESTIYAAVNSYLTYADSQSYMGQQASAQVLQQTTASAGTMPQRLLDGALLGAVFAALLGVIAALAGARATIGPLAAPRRVRGGAPGFEAGQQQAAGGNPLTGSEAEPPNP
jgi:hypothetical protein